MECWLGSDSRPDSLKLGLVLVQVRCIGANDGSVMWQIPKAHRGIVSAIHTVASSQFLLTGGEDGTIRIWSQRTREFLQQISK